MNRTLLRAGAPPRASPEQCSRYDSLCRTPAPMLPRRTISRRNGSAPIGAPIIRALPLPNVPMTRMGFSGRTTELKAAESGAWAGRRARSFRGAALRQCIVPCGQGFGRVPLRIVENQVQIHLRQGEQLTAGATRCQRWPAMIIGRNHEQHSASHGSAAESAPCSREAGRGQTRTRPLCRLI